MSWDNLFNTENQPTNEDIIEFIGEGSSLWVELTSYIEEAYKTEQKIAYSKCSAQPGWNIKYQKSGKSLCTLYPMDGFFIALIVIGAKEEEAVDISFGSLTPHVRELYSKTSFSCGGRWLMIKVKNEETLKDIKKLISIRVKPKI